MRGKVLDFSLQNGGLITAEDGQRYRFEPSEWKEQNMPVRGMLVDFDTNGQQAIAIYLLALPKTTPTAPRTITTSNINVSTNREEATLLDYAIAVVKEKYADFNGRARRKEYGGFVLFSTLISFGLQLLYSIGFAISDNVGVLLSLPFFIYSLGVMVPHLAVGARRLHDINKSGWWMLIGLIPLIGAIWLIVLCCQDGMTEENQFGPNPKQ